MRRTASLIGGLILTIVIVVPALGHSALIAASPGPGQIVGGEVRSIDMVFDAGFEQEVAGLEGPEGIFVATEMSRPTDTTLRLEFEPLEFEGQYIVWYEFLSADTDPVEAAFAFSFEVAAPPPSPITATSATLEVDDGKGWVFWTATTVMAAAVLFLALQLLHRLWRLRQREEPAG